jgi:hypothetical protein
MTWLDSIMIVPMILLFITGSTLALFKPSMRSIPVLAVQYLAVSWLVYPKLHLVGVIANTITGIMVCVIFFLGIRQLGDDLFPEEEQLISARLPFRIIALLLITVASVSVARSSLFAHFEIRAEANIGATFLIATSLLNLGLETDQLRSGIGLLTLIAGGGVIYSYIEPSLAVIALLAMVQLGIALVLSYFISIRTRFAPSESGPQ